MNIFDPDSTIGEGIADAGSKATSYITDIDGSGIWVTPSDAKPVNGAAASTTRGWHIAEALEYFIGAVRYIKAWVNGTIPTVRLGQDSAGHADVTPDGMEIFTDATTSVASFGSESRVGRANSKHVTSKSDGVYFYDGSTEMGAIKPMTGNAYPQTWGITYDSGQWEDGANGNAITFNHMTQAFGSSSNIVGGYIYLSSQWYQLAVPMGQVLDILNDGGIDPAEVATSSQYNLQMSTIWGSGQLCGVLVRSSTNTSSSYDLGTVSGVQLRQVELGHDNLVLDANIVTGDIAAGTIVGGIAGNFARTSHIIVNAASVAAGGYLSGNLSISNSGYTPISVAGQTSDQRYVSFIRAYISDATDGSGTLNWMVYNPTTSAKTPTMRVYVLWAKS